VDCEKTYKALWSFGPRIRLCVRESLVFGSKHYKKKKKKNNKRNKFMCNYKILLVNFLFFNLY